MNSILDFESRSACDLGTAGPWKYASHPSTEILSLGVKTGVMRGALWYPEWVSDILGDIAPPAPRLSDDVLLAAVTGPGKLIAHNAEFERAMWYHIMHKRYGFPHLPINRWDCTAARSAVLTLPRKLELVCKALNLSAEKDMEGHALMLKMCKPRKPRKAEREALIKAWNAEEIDTKTFHVEGDKMHYYFWHETPEDIYRCMEYCIGDLEAEYELDKTVPQLIPSERTAWEHDQFINQRGIHIDVESAEIIIESLSKVEAGLLNELTELTDERVKSTRQTQAYRDWLLEKDVHTDNIQKTTVLELLDKELPDDVRRTLNIRQELAKASTAKFTAMVNRAEDDHRARATAMHHGASTGRPAGKAIQPFNMPRASFTDPALAFAVDAFKHHDMDRIRAFFGEPYQTASKCLRGMLCAAPGKILYGADFSSVESNGNSWLAGEQWKLEAFAAGIDSYKTIAADTFNVTYEEVTKDQRTIGKVQDLAMGYQGGIGSVATFANTYNIDVETFPAIVMPLVTDDDNVSDKWGAEDLARRYRKKAFANSEVGGKDVMSFEAAVACDVLKQKWRRKHPGIVRSWKGYEKAARQAILDPKKVYSFRKIKYKMYYDRLGNAYLTCLLPSGRILYYADPQIRQYPRDDAVEGEEVELSQTITHMKTDSTTGRWVRRSVYGGLFCENVTQAICRDIHVSAMQRVEQAGYPVMLHVYDEIVSEAPQGFGSLDEFIRVMEIMDPWAKGFPIRATGWTGREFRK